MLLINNSRVRKLESKRERERERESNRNIIRGESPICIPLTTNIVIAFIVRREFLETSEIDRYLLDWYLLLFAVILSW